MKISRIGLIGLGKHGSRYAAHVEEDFPDLQVTAVCRGTPGLLARDAARAGARGFADFRDLLRSGSCDAVIAVVPPHLHLAIVEGCCAAGLPLLLEKPAAIDLESARAMQRLVSDHPIPLMVAQTLRYNAVVRTLREHLDAVGRITSISMSQRFEPSRLDWLDDPARSGAGIVLHTGVHCFDLMRHLTGLRPHTVTAQVARVRTQRTEDNCAATVELDGGVLATVSLARTTQGRTGHVELAGDLATLAGDHVLNSAILVRGREVTPLSVGEALPTVREIIRDFVSHVDAGQVVPIPLREGLEAVAVSFACLESARTGRTVNVPEID
jgi:predicted dehydrogenase